MLQNVHFNDLLWSSISILPTISSSLIEFRVNMEAGHMLHCSFPSWKSVRFTSWKPWRTKSLGTHLNQSTHWFKKTSWFNGSKKNDNFNQPLQVASRNLSKTPCRVSTVCSLHLPHPRRFRRTPVLRPRDCHNHGRRSLHSEQSLGVWYAQWDKNISCLMMNKSWQCNVPFEKLT